MVDGQRTLLLTCDSRLETPASQPRNAGRKLALRANRNNKTFFSPQRQSGASSTARRDLCTFWQISLFCRLLQCVLPHSEFSIFRNLFPFFRPPGISTCESQRPATSQLQPPKTFFLQRQRKENFLVSDFSFDAFGEVNN